MSHLMVEVPAQNLLTPVERTLPQERQDSIALTRFGRIQDSLFQNYLTRHMSYRVRLHDGVMFVRRSVKSLTRKK